ncbi:MAG: cupredoxin domain-containing protein [Candidatus Eisenbacteria bacterium]
MKRSIAIGLAALINTGCSSGFNHPVREVTAGMGSDHVQRVSLTTHTFWFDPNRVVVKVGIPVELTIRNGAFFVPHDFSCEAKEAGIDVDEKVGMFHGSKVVRFTPTRAGEYPFHCDVDSHAKKGMMGALVVVEP